MLTRLLSPERLPAALAALLLAVSMVAAAPASAQTAQTKYERALAREEAARAAEAPAVATLRSIAVAYENIVRQHPRSGYSDNALWQGAGVLQLAWERAGQARDRDQALRLLQWLRREYPSSSLVRQISSRTAALNKPRTAVARSSTPSNAPGTAPEPENVVTPTAAAPSARVAEAVTAGPAPATVAPQPSTFPRAAASSGPPAAPARTAAAAGALPRTAPPVVVRGLSHTALPRGDRLTFELSDESTYAAEPATATGGELVLTVPDAQAAAAIVTAASSIRGSLIRSVRIDNGDDGLRVVVSVVTHARHSAFPLYSPTRLVFDFEDAGVAAAPSQAAALQSPDSAAGTRPAAVREPSANVPASPAAARPAAVAASPATQADDSGEDQDSVSPAPPASIRGSYSLARQLGLGVSRIVIDPGHGGSDPGASANGVTEAALVLDVALRLEKLLQAQPGFEVVLTRRTNAAVPLARRTAIANEEAADLFLSIHANSSPRRETAGVETYFLNLATNPQAEAVAARENASSAQAMRTLPQLVRAITNNNKLAESREFANVVQTSLVRRLRSQNPNFQNLGVKQAPFMVLVGAQMPSVLAEIAFVSNRTEAGLLKQNAYKQQIAQALCDAILQYRGSLKKMTTVAASTEGR